MTDEKNEVTIVSSQLEELKDKISNETDIEQLKQVVNLFNLNIKKKEILRKGVISELQDKAIDQISERITKHGHEFSNKDLLDYTKTFKDLLDKNDSLDEDSITSIQFNPTQININVEDNELNSESRQKVADAVKAILKRTQNENVVDVEVKTTNEEVEDEEDSNNE